MSTPVLLLPADAPGMAGDDINVELQGNTLKVSGQKSQQREEGGQGHKVWRQERSFSQFSRSFELPENAQPEGISANLDHGVLTVEVSNQSQSVWNLGLGVVELAGSTLIPLLLCIVSRFARHVNRALRHTPVSWILMQHPQTCLQAGTKGLLYIYTCVGNSSLRSVLDPACPVLSCVQIPKRQAAKGPEAKRIPIGQGQGRK
jgi:hypothetical protein